MLANRIAEHSLCDVGLVGATGIPNTRSWAEHEQTVTTIARMRKIDLNVRGPEPEAEGLFANDE